MPTQLTRLTVAPDARLKAIEDAVREYHAALDRREHGGVACHKAMEKIECAFGVYWRAASPVGNCEAPNGGGRTTSDCPGAECRRTGQCQVA